MGKGCDCISATTSLWILVFLGFAVNYMERVNMNIAIVAMVKSTHKSSQDVVGECFSVNFTNATSGLFVDLSKISVSSEEDDPGPIFEWDENQQGQVLGAYYWLHWILQLPGGILARQYGTKLIFGLANLIPILLTFLIPWASFWDYRALLAIRILQGLFAGMAWPSMHNMAAKWIPPNERSKFITAYLGSAVGSGFTLPLSGLLIHAYGWESVFYVCGALGMLWILLWWIYVFDSPSHHPRISQKELQHILREVGKTVTDDKGSTPWREILSSRAVWVNIVAQWGGVFGFFTLITQSPSYFRYIFGWNIGMTGLLSGLPHLLRMLWALGFSIVGDHLLRTQTLSRTNVRKLATFFCTVMQGVFIICLMYVGCNAYAAIVFLTAATAVHGTVSTGPLASIVDMSPNFASVILGLNNMITVLPGFISPVLVAQLTLNNQKAEQWQKVFAITAGQLLICGIVYVLFAESDLQPWNSPGPIPSVDSPIKQKPSQKGDSWLSAPSTNLEEMKSLRTEDASRQLP